MSPKRNHGLCINRTHGICIPVRKNANYTRFGSCLAGSFEINLHVVCCLTALHGSFPLTAIFDLYLSRKMGGALNLAIYTSKVAYPYLGEESLGSRLAYPILLASRLADTYSIRRFRTIRRAKNISLSKLFSHQEKGREKSFGLRVQVSFDTRSEREAARSAARELSYLDLKPEQLKVVLTFVKGRDVFAVLNNIH